MALVARCRAFEDRARQEVGAPGRDQNLVLLSLLNRCLETMDDLDVEARRLRRRDHEHNG